MELGLLLLGLVGLWLGSEQVVAGAKVLAKRLGISELLIGVTIVSIGTSLPEIMVTVFSGAKGASDVAIGSMIGSCLAQITIILGIAAIVHDVHASKKAMQVDGPMMIIGILLFGWFLYSEGRITQFEGLVMILLYGTYMYYTSKVEVIAEHKKQLGTHAGGHSEAWKRIAQLLIGIGILIFSAHLVLENAVEIARMYGLSESFIGVMIIGTASCLPELSTAIVGMFKRAPSIAVGTLIGSNITDPLFSTGLGALINGFETNMDLLRFDLFFWFLSSCIAMYLLHRKSETLIRNEALILVTIYFVFVGMKVGFVPIPEVLVLPIS